jgi:hypothetical protein
MRKAWTPSIVPAGTDQNIYLVMDDLEQIPLTFSHTPHARRNLHIPGY